MNKQSDSRHIEKLLDIMAALRDRSHGCPWDLEQTFATIAPYTIEEAYEVADAIERGALDELSGELGDLLFQVVFHARMAEEAGAFAFGDVVAGICDKLVRRHPHVFEQGTPRVDASDQSRIWEQIKRDERDAAGAGRVLADVPVGLPGLSRAAKLGKRAATVGFDWPDAAGVRAKIREELAELDAALDGAARSEAPVGSSLAASEAVTVDDARAGHGAVAPDGARAGHGAVAAEIGDLLFTIANLCRHLDLDPEACVRGANARFEKRFGYVEARVRERGGDWSVQSAEALDQLWQDAKRAKR
jgi:MazG family protein